MMRSGIYTKLTPLNNNYEPLKHQDATLQFYFKELFDSMDHYSASTQEIHDMPRFLLNKLLERYLRFAKIDTEDRVILQQPLVQNMKSVLYAEPSECPQQEVKEMKSELAVEIPQGLRQAFQLLNKSAYNILPNDDLIWLLSAYCSVFPFINRMLTSGYFKYALTYRDINNIYRETFVKPLTAHPAGMVDIYNINKTTIEIVLHTDQYESFLKKCMEQWESSGITKYTLGILLKPATVDQLEQIVLNRILSLQGHDDLVIDAMRMILDKVSAEIIERKILPELFKIFQQTTTPAIENVNKRAHNFLPAPTRLIDRIRI